MSTLPVPPSPLAGLPPIDQVGFVVRDLHAALRVYEPLFGPFVVNDGPAFDAVYRGRPEPARMAVANGRSGQVQIELIEWKAGATPHRDFLESGREGMQHLRFPVGSVAAWVPRAVAEGYVPVWWGSLPSYGLDWCYFERPGDPLMIEFVSPCQPGGAVPR